MVNPWEWDDRNPYHATPFQILDVQPTADRATFRARVAARRKRIAYDAARFPLFGEVLSVAQVNAAEEQLADPRTRLAAELLTHRPEPGGDDVDAAAELLDLAGKLSAASRECTVGSDSAIELDYRILRGLLPPPPGFAEDFTEETDG